MPDIMEWLSFLIHQGEEEMSRNVIRPIIPLLFVSHVILSTQQPSYVSAISGVSEMDGSFADASRKTVLISRIIVPFPNHVGYGMPILVDVVNAFSSTIDAFIDYDILDENFDCVYCSGWPPPVEISVAGGETTRVELNGFYPEAGLFHIRVIAAADGIEPICDTILTPSPIFVWESDMAALGYFDRFATDTTLIEAIAGSGPMLRYSPEGVFWTDHVGLERVVLKGKNLNGFLEVNVYEGKSDSSFGEPLGSPFLVEIEGPKDEVDICLPDHENDEPLSLIGNDFWIHIQATGQTEGCFVARASPLDTCRNWWYDSEELVPSVVSWEILAVVFKASPYAPGDATMDGSVNVLDALAVANHILGVKVIQGIAYCYADCTADGILNILDVLGIANNILGMGTCKLCK